MKKQKNLITFIVSFVLIAAVALCLSSCGKTDKDKTSNKTDMSKAQTVGEGKTSFDFAVTKADGSKKTFVVKTDEDNVGDALKTAGLIKGEDGEYGLTVTTVDGETHDFNKDKYYWAFYIDGEYAMTGVSETKISSGKLFELRATK